MDPTLREMLAAAKKEHGPAPGDRERLRAKIDTAIARPKLPLKVIVPVTVAIVAALIGWRFFPTSPPQATPLPAPSASAAPIIASEPRIEAGPSVETISVSDLPKSPSAIATTVAPTASPSGDSLAEEMRLIADAQRAIKSRDFAGALVACDEHARRFPHGVLSEERDAARVVSLCGVGRTQEGQKAQKAFLTAHPQSPLASRVREQCQ